MLTSAKAIRPEDLRFDEYIGASAASLIGCRGDALYGVTTSALNRMALG